jgi:SAM-dependent methyltransferase
MRCEVAESDARPFWQFASGRGGGDAGWQTVAMLRSLDRRPRGRLALALARRLTLAPQRERLAELKALEDLPLQRDVRVAHPSPGVVTRHYAQQLDGWEPDLHWVPAEVRDTWDGADPEGREFLRVMLAVWQDAPGFVDRTGLSRADPPEHIHAMARGPLAAGGAFHAADAVADAVHAAGMPVADIGRALDFGGSSGRVVRALAPALPEVEWYSCDPNAAAIAWATEHVPGVAFSVSPQVPPLTFDDDHFGLVFAISVWSHLSERAALRWLTEMRRVVRPGGLLVLTVQSSQTAHNLAANALWRMADVRTALADLYARGHHFRQNFGPGGDFGVESPDWGFALLSAEWLVRHVTPAWELVLWRPGALEGDQDVVVLRRAATPPGDQAGTARKFQIGWSKTAAN